MHKELKTVQWVQWPLLIVDIPDWVKVTFEEIVEVSVPWEKTLRTWKIRKSS